MTEKIVITINKSSVPEYKQKEVERLLAQLLVNLRANYIAYEGHGLELVGHKVHISW
jgi:hypothetical protein